MSSLTKQALTSSLAADLLRMDTQQRLFEQLRYASIAINMQDTADGLQGCPRGTV